MKEGVNESPFDMASVLYPIKTVQTVLTAKCEVNEFCNISTKIPLSILFCECGYAGDGSGCRGGNGNAFLTYTMACDEQVSVFSSQTRSGTNSPILERWKAWLVRAESEEPGFGLFDSRPFPIALRHVLRRRSLKL